MFKIAARNFAAMKHYLLTVLLLPYMAQGQTTEADTAAVRELDGITVTAVTQRSDAVKTVYTPTGRQKATASDGLSLLARMKIPQLSVNPVTETIKTADQQAVSLFINFNQAKSEDVAGLNPSDVKTVEYLDFPVDPRFLGAHHVVNFITREYAYGGYTKINGRERFMISSGDASVYSKFAYRRMSYDLMVSGDYDNNKHIGSVSDETYKFRDGTISRNSTTEGARHRERGLFAGLRASWNKDSNLTFRNMLSYRRNHTPVSETSGRVSFSKLYPAEQYTAASPTTSNSIDWNSELYSSMGKGWSIYGTINAELLDNSTADSYATATSRIENRADEKAMFLRGDIRANKSLTDRITLFSTLSSAGGKTKIDYTGSSNVINRFKQTFTGLWLGAALNFQKVAGSVDCGYAFESNSINRQKIDDRYPFTHINVQYAPDQKNSLSLYFQYATMSPDAVMKNPNLIRQSELMYVCGNPGLKAARHITGNVSYTWLPDNRWQMTAYATLFRIIDRQIEVYSPDGPDGAMLKQYRNDGDYNHGQIGASVTGRFFDGRLAMSAVPRLLLYRTTGSNRASHYPLTGSLSADYYLRDFVFSAFWSSRTSYVDGETSYLRRMPPEYSVSVGWASKGWNIRLSAANIFRTSWQISRDTLSTRWYDSSLSRLGAGAHRRVTLTVTYTVNYGKKVSPSDELAPDTDITTSILR